MKEIVIKFIKFGIVGFVGLLIDFGVTYLLKEKLKFNKFFANSIGFSLAVINNYLLNKYWSFESREHQYLREFTVFLTISIIGPLINNGIVYLLNVRYGRSFYLAKVISLAIVAFWNFFMNYFITFG